MKTTMPFALPVGFCIVSCCLGLTFVGGWSVRAQITFTASTLPSVPGDYINEYVSSSTDPSTQIGPIGGPQVWDFSYAPQSGDITRRMDIVQTTDGGNQASFPKATYAERYTDSVNGQFEWDYYSIASGGRTFYGSYNITAGSPNIFSPVSIDVPATVGYGSNWNYTFSTVFDSIEEVDSVSATVDAYGTLILPNLGRFQALRVNQLTYTEEYVSGLGLYNTYYIREYYWLVPGFDKAVDITSQATSSPPPALFTSAYEVRRVYQTNTVPSAPGLVSGLSLNLQHGQVFLNWSAASYATNYQIQFLGNLTATNWQALAAPVSNSWSEALTRTQRFYRVFIEP